MARRGGAERRFPARPDGARVTLRRTACNLTVTNRLFLELSSDCVQTVVVFGDRAAESKTMVGGGRALVFVGRGKRSFS